MTNKFELFGKTYPCRYINVKTPIGEETWCISVESLNDTITHYGHRDLTSEIIDDEVFFYVEDDVLFSEDLVEYLKQHLDVDFEFIKFED